MVTGGRTVTSEMDHLRTSMADLCRRVERLETRGSDTAVESLQKVEYLTDTVDGIDGKIDSLISKFDRMYEGGCSLAELHDEKIANVRILASEAKSIAVETHDSMIGVQVKQGLIVAVATAVMVAAMNWLVRVI